MLAPFFFILFYNDMLIALQETGLFIIYVNIACLVIKVGDLDDLEILSSRLE